MTDDPYHRPNRLGLVACHACGDLRPEAEVGLHSRYRRMARVHSVPPRSAAASTLGVRYCADRPRCLAVARAIGEEWARTGRRIQVVPKRLGADDPRDLWPRRRVLGTAGRGSAQFRRSMAAAAKESGAWPWYDRLGDWLLHDLMHLGKRTRP